MGGDVPLRSDRWQLVWLCPRIRALRSARSAHAHRTSSASSITRSMRPQPHDLHFGYGPTVVYASDPLGAGPGLLAARLAGAALVYHEHDSPSPGMLHPILARWRAAAARAARLIVFPNEERARFAQSELRFSDNRLHIVWNVPRRAELVASAATAEPPLIVYYHGSITPERLPETVAFAVRRMVGLVRLRIVGYEAPSARGYVRHLVGSDNGTAADAPIEYLGMPSRADLMAEAARAHIGLSLMPFNPTTSTSLHMAGASNKPFDYMAAGLALLVSDLPDWKTDVCRSRLWAGMRSH